MGAHANAYTGSTRADKRSNRTGTRRGGRQPGCVPDGLAGRVQDLTTLLLDVLQARLAGEDDPLVEDHQVKSLSPTAMDDNSNVRIGLYLHAISTDTDCTSESPEIDNGHKTRLAVEECDDAVAGLPGSPKPRRW